MSAVSKTVELQTLLQSQLDSLKSKRIGKLFFPHAAMVHGKPTTASPVYTLGNLCETIVNWVTSPMLRFTLKYHPIMKGKSRPPLRSNYPCLIKR